MLRPTFSRPVCLRVKHSSGAQDQNFVCRQTVAGLFMWAALPDERTGLSFTIAAGLRQCSHSRVRVPRESWPCFIVSDSRLSQPGGSGSRMYIPEEQCGPVIPPGTSTREWLWLRVRVTLRLEVYRPISSWQQAPWCSRQVILFYSWTLAVIVLM
jgi:hypothetical protein